jgi:hypothetical protein
MIEVKMRYPVLALALVTAAPALACTDKDPLGCSVKQNIVTQTVDMNPTYAGTQMEGGVGQRSANAVNRYMNDKIRPLARTDLRSEVGSQGGISAAKDPSGVQAPQ